MMRAIGILFSVLYALNAWLGSVAGTCTMGDDGHFIASIIYGLPIALIAGITLWRSRNISQYGTFALFSSVISCVFVVFIWAPILWSTSIQGNHLCGSEFNYYINGPYTLERFVPLLHIIVIVVLFLFTTLGLKQVPRSRNA